MGSWGITMRQSDYGLDLLGTIRETHLKKVNFTVFNVAEAIEAIREDIMTEIRQANRGCSAKQLVFYFSQSFPERFTQGALLVAECLADYYRGGELIVQDYVGERRDPVEHHIKEFVVTEADLRLLLDELKDVQDPEHELYQSWFKEEVRQEWLTYVRSMQEELEKHLAS